MTMATARPSRRPGFGNHHHENTENEISSERSWRAYRLPGHIRLPSFLAGKLGEPTPTFVSKKIMDGKYLLISPALIFKIKEIDPEASTTAVPETSTDGVDEETTTDVDSGEVVSSVPSFESRSFSFDDDEDVEVEVSAPDD